jgi:hypothetical protein
MILKLINIGMFGLMILMNYLANALPLNNKTTGELSDQYPNLFVPAGITFSIWGIIYILLVVFLILQFRDSNKSLVASIGWAFALSSLFNALWILAWHYELLPLSLLIMIGLLLCLIFISWKIYPLQVGWIKAAFGVYLGWICVATIANVTALLVNYNWGGWGIPAQIWAITMIGIGLIIAAFSLIRLQNPFIGLAVIWAFGGIVLKRLGDNTYVETAAVIAIGMMLVVTVWVFMYPAFYKSGVK